jgi:3'-phosphoadenosine 5'-phosphosulfate sulfotransferase (PAPS reductase)/FAD synthetase
MNPTVGPLLDEAWAEYFAKLPAKTTAKKQIAIAASTPRYESERKNVQSPMFGRDISKKPVYFASGSNHPGEIKQFAAMGYGVGVAAPAIRAAGELALVNLAGTGTQVFVDSGAFSEVAFPPNAPPVVKDPITHAQWTERLGLYHRLAGRLGPQLTVVAPDRVGSQSVTLQRLTRYSGDVAALADMGARVLVPLQRGERTLEQFGEAVRETLGDVKWTPAIPLKAAATKFEDLLTYMRDVQPPDVHLLGVGDDTPDARRIEEMIARVSPDTRVTQDSSSTIKANVGSGDAPSQRKAAAKKIATKRAKRAAADARYVGGGLFGKAMPPGKGWHRIPNPRGGRLGWRKHGTMGRIWDYKYDDEPTQSGAAKPKAAPRANAAQLEAAITRAIDDVHDYNMREGKRNYSEKAVLLSPAGEIVTVVEGDKGHNGAASVRVDPLAGRALVHSHPAHLSLSFGDALQLLKGARGGGTRTAIAVASSNAGEQTVYRLDVVGDVPTPFEWNTKVIHAQERMQRKAMAAKRRRAKALGYSREDVHPIPDSEFWSDLTAPGGPLHGALKYTETKRAAADARYVGGGLFGKAMAPLIKKMRRHPPAGAGWMPVPNGKKNGYRKMVGGSWRYWYPHDDKSQAGAEESQLDLFGWQAPAPDVLDGMRGRADEYRRDLAVYDLPDAKRARYVETEAGKARRSISTTGPVHVPSQVIDKYVAAVADMAADFHDLTHELEASVDSYASRDPDRWYALGISGISDLEFTEEGQDLIKRAASAASDSEALTTLMGDPKIRSAVTGISYLTLRDVVEMNGDVKGVDKELAGETWDALFEAEDSEEQAGLNIRRESSVTPYWLSLDVEDSDVKPWLDHLNAGILGVLRQSIAYQELERIRTTYQWDGFAGSSTNEGIEPTAAKVVAAWGEVVDAAQPPPDMSRYNFAQYLDNMTNSAPGSLDVGYSTKEAAENTQKGEKLGHWGAATSENEVAYTSALTGDHGRFRPTDKNMELVEPGPRPALVKRQPGVFNAQMREAKRRYLYAQERMNATPRDAEPNLYRGMMLPADVMKVLAKGSTIPLTGCTAFSFQSEIAERYSNSSWTMDHSDDASMPMVITMERDDASDLSVAGWHDHKEDASQPAFEVVSGANALEVIEVTPPALIAAPDAKVRVGPAGTYTAKLLASRIEDGVTVGLLAKQYDDGANAYFQASQRKDGAWGKFGAGVENEVPSDWGWGEINTIWRIKARAVLEGDGVSKARGPKRDSPWRRAVVAFNQAMADQPIVQRKPGPLEKAWGALIKAAGHKYISRTGTPGNYKYEYSEAKGRSGTQTVMFGETGDLAPAPRAKRGPRAKRREKPSKQMGMFSDMEGAALDNAAARKRKTVARPEFARWFGDSKVVGPDGEPAEQWGAKPVKVYHGTASGGFSEFSKRKDKGSNIFGKGFYFTADKSIAQEYTEKDEKDAYRTARGILDADGQPVTTLDKAGAAHILNSVGWFTTPEADADLAAGRGYSLPDPGDYSAEKRAKWRSNGNNSHRTMYAVVKASDAHGNMDIAEFYRVMEDPDPTDVERERLSKVGVRYAGASVLSGDPDSWTSVHSAKGMQRAAAAHDGWTLNVPPPEVFEVFLSLQNPLDMDTKATREGFAGLAASTAAAQHARDAKQLESTKEKFAEFLASSADDQAETVQLRRYFLEGRNGNDAPRGYGYMHDAKGALVLVEAANPVEAYKGFEAERIANTERYLTGIGQGEPLIHGLYLGHIAHLVGMHGEESMDQAYTRVMGKSYAGPHSFDDLTKLYRAIRTESKGKTYLPYGDDRPRQVAGALYVTDSDDMSWQDLQWLITDGQSADGMKGAFTEWAKSDGYDGMKHTGGWNVGSKEHDVWIAFEPKQIKATTATDFDTSSADIYKGPFSSMLTRIFKGALIKHKYIKRTPTGNPKRPWRYDYAPGHEPKRKRKPAKRSKPAAKKGHQFDMFAAPVADFMKADVPAFKHMLEVDPDKPWTHPDWAPDLAGYDHIMVNSSGGKDSQAQLTRVVELCDKKGIPRDRIVVVHADLGKVEWDETKELAQLQAEHYGVRFEAVSNPDGDLIEGVMQRFDRMRERHLDATELARHEITTWVDLAAADKGTIAAYIGPPTHPRSFDPMKRATLIQKKARAEVAKETAQRKKDVVGGAQAVAAAAETIAKLDGQIDALRARPKLTTRQAAQLARLKVRTFEAERKRDATLAAIDGRKADGQIDFGAVVPWPSSAARWCTSDWKTRQVRKLYTRLASEHSGPDKAKILSCLGIRAQESPERAKKAGFKDGIVATGNQHVDEWYPIFGWPEEQVWNTIDDSGIPYHDAYDKGMGRLSCVFCVFAPKEALAIAAEHNPELFKTYLELEQTVGASFKPGESLQVVVDLLKERNGNSVMTTLERRALQKALVELDMGPLVEALTVGLTLYTGPLQLDWKDGGACVHLFDPETGKSPHIAWMPNSIAGAGSLVALAVANAAGVRFDENGAPPPQDPKALQSLDL